MPSQSAEKIYQAATRLFGERSYPSTSMRDIGEAVGILAGSLYSHISSKEALLFDIVDTSLDRYLATVSPIATSPAPADKRLRDAIKAHVKLVGEHVEETLVALQQWKYLSEPNRKQVVSKRQACADLFTGMIEDGVAAGVFKPVPNRHIAVAGIMGMLNWVPEWFSPRGPETAGQIGDDLADLILSGLANAPRSRSKAPRESSVA
ncbi:MAG: TetR/AcrR family transcriptional regulator [Acidimicrobiia bacterium]